MKPLDPNYISCIYAIYSLINCIYIYICKVTYMNELSNYEKYEKLIIIQEKIIQ